MEPETPKRNVALAWILNQLYNTSFLVLMGLFASGVIFWSVTTSTLSSHTTDLIDIKKTAAEERAANLAERTQLRTEFLIESKATAAGIADLKTQGAVVNTVLSGMEKRLERIADKLESVPLAPRPR